MTTILIAIIAVVILAGLFGAVLGFASIKFKMEADPIVDQIDSILPQTQCGQCGYQVAALTLKLLPTVMLLTSVLRAVSLLSKNWQT
ncbi:electron transport complex protein RnfB [Vibrio maritimus]|uniref:Electron transport complex protein RnfB n=1 Tax=Vibrio maritimus TaxID=990268 RepID=A0A090S299_9VIBR|nr:electron transport complex protein RnfB [Vibrio maritimus]